MSLSCGPTTFLPITAKKIHHAASFTAAGVEELLVTDLAKLITPLVANKGRLIDVDLASEGRNLSFAHNRQLEGMCTQPTAPTPAPLRAHDRHHLLLSIT